MRDIAFIVGLLTSAFVAVMYAIAIGGALAATWAWFDRD